MEIYLQKSVSDNVIATIQNLILVLGLPVTKSSITKIKKNPNFPSLNSIAEILSEWNIENMGVDLSVEQLSDIPYPSVAHLHKNNGHFVVLTKLTDGIIQYIDPEIGLINEPLKEFEKKWTGVALLVSANETSGEVGYKEKRRTEIFEQVSSWIIIVLLSVLFVLPFFYIHLSIFTLYLLKIMGGLTCYFLLQKQFGVENTYVDSLCTFGTHSDCNALIRSKASVFFGIIHLSELGLLYFAGGLLTLIISSVAFTPVSGVVVVFTMLALPFTFYSVYYQWRLAKVWCTLCIVVMAVFWMEFASFFIAKKFSWSWQVIEISFIGYTLPIIFWLAVRSRLIDSFKIPGLEKALNRFIKSENVFKALLQSQPSIEIGTFKYGISIGSKDAPVTITLVSNPTCAPCASAHFVIDDLLDRYKDKVRVRFLFLIDVANKDSVSYQVASHLIKLSMSATEGELLKAFSSWYAKNEETNLSAWLANHPIDSEIHTDEIETIIMEQQNWCRLNGVNETPTVFIKNNRLPEEFTIKDLKYQVKNLLG